MRKIIGLAIGCVLGGCTTQPAVVQKPTIAEPHLNYFRQDTSPLPWVTTIPSERAVDYKDVDFGAIDRHLRRSMAVDFDKFKKVDLVLLDYTVLEAVGPHKKLTKKKHQGQAYCKKYILKPKRYFMRMSCYERHKRPPAPPLFEGTAVMDVTKAFPLEALSFMIDELILEHRRLPLKKIEVNLD